MQLQVSAVASHLYVVVDGKLKFFPLLHMHHLPNADDLHGSRMQAQQPDASSAKAQLQHNDDLNLYITQRSNRSKQASKWIGSSSTIS